MPRLAPASIHYAGVRKPRVEKIVAVVLGVAFELDLRAQRVPWAYVGAKSPPVELDSAVGAMSLSEVAVSDFELVHLMISLSSCLRALACGPRNAAALLRK